jgi:hypothetical protein
MVTATIINNGKIVALVANNPTASVIKGDISGNGTIDVWGRTLELTGAVSNTIVLDNYGTVKLDKPQLFTGSVLLEAVNNTDDNYLGDTIDLAGIVASSVTASGPHVTVHETNGQNLTLDVYALPMGQDPSTYTTPIKSGLIPFVTSDGNGGTSLYFGPRSWAAAVGGVPLTSVGGAE